jgi:hypothetical protein
LLSLEVNASRVLFSYSSLDLRRCIHCILQIKCI